MKKFSIEIKWGVIFTIASLIWMLFEKAIGLHDEYIANQLIYTNFFGLVAITIYVFALLDKRNQYYKRDMNWQQGFIAGVVISIIVAFLNPMVQHITYTYISPNYFAEMINFQVGHKYMTVEKANAYFNKENFLYKDMIPGLSMGIVTSAVVAMVVQTKSIKK